jgi:hypothetical protein
VVNEVAERLQALSVKTAFPLTLPELDDIVVAQEEMLISIPPVFREYLLHSSDTIYGDYEPVTIADPNAHTYLPEVAAEAWATGLPRDVLPLCQTAQDYYCIGDDDTVYLWHAETGELEEIAESIWYWARDIWINESDAL